MRIEKEVLAFDIHQYPFEKIIAQLIGTTNLQELSCLDGEKPISREASFYKNMEQSVIFQNFYDKLSEPEGQLFYDLYNKFILEIIRPQFEEGIFYQKIPSHRILFKDIKGTARFHKDSDYGHQPSEINYWLPQTKTFDSNTIWLASDKNTRELEDHEPVLLELGQYLKFNGASLSHGAVENRSGFTRVSFDFRIIPESKADYKKLTDNEGFSSSNPVMSNAKKFVYCE